MSTATELPPLSVEDIAGRYLERVETVEGWIGRGVEAPGGRAYLRATMVHGRWSVRPDDLVDFLRARHPEPWESASE